MLDRTYYHDKVPTHTLDSISKYVLTGTEPGHFVKAVLSDKLFESFARADPDNQAAMHNIIKFIYNECPGGCQGSPEKVEAWIKKGGLNKMGAGEFFNTVLQMVEQK